MRYRFRPNVKLIAASSSSLTFLKNGIAFEVDFGPMGTQDKSIYPGFDRSEVSDQAFKRLRVYDMIESSNGSQVNDSNLSGESDLFIQLLSDSREIQASISTSLQSPEVSVLDLSLSPGRTSISLPQFIVKYITSIQDLIQRPFSGMLIVIADSLAQPDLKSVNEYCINSKIDWLFCLDESYRFSIGPLFRNQAKPLSCFECYLLRVESHRDSHATRSEAVRLSSTSNYFNYLRDAWVQIDLARALVRPQDFQNLIRRFDFFNESIEKNTFIPAPNCPTCGGFVSDSNR